MRPLALSLVALLLATPSLTLAETREERAVVKTVEKEMSKVVKYAMRHGDLAQARAELELALKVAPDSSKLERGMKSLERKEAHDRDSERTLKASFVNDLEERRQEAHAEVALALAHAARSVEEDDVKAYERYVALVQDHFRTPEALDVLDLRYFAPYYEWVSASEASLLESGGERLDGKDLDQAAVEGLNQQHSSWSNPWVISDGVHEVRTTVSLREAKQILAYVGAYRKYFLARFSADWDLRAPKGKLPVIVTRTQAEMKEQMAKVTGGMGASNPGQQTGVQGAAFYLQTNSQLNPCFVTYEPMEATGRTFKVTDFTQLQIPLAHEITHQIVFEYSKYDCNRTRQVQYQFWTVEAIANFMGYHKFDGTQWTLTHPRTIPMGSGMIEGPFAHCKNNVSSLPSLRDFMALTPAQFMTVNNYHMAATLAYFLLTGEHGKYRKQFLALLAEVHKVKDAPDSFERAFPGVDLDAMQQEYIEFVKGIELDD